MSSWNVQAKSKIAALYLWGSDYFKRLNTAVSVSSSGLNAFLWISKFRQFTKMSKNSIWCLRQAVNKTLLWNLLHWSSGIICLSSLHNELHAVRVMAASNKPNYSDSYSHVTDSWFFVESDKLLSWVNCFPNVMFAGDERHDFDDFDKQCLAAWSWTLKWFWQNLLQLEMISYDWSALDNVAFVVTMTGEGTRVGPQTSR